MPVLTVQNLSKHYGNIHAVDGVSFSVGKNEIVGLLGPNGAGKTTTINMILGVLEPSAGAIKIDGIDIGKERSRALERTNFAAVYAQLPGNLSVVENLRVFGLLYDTPRLESRIEELLALLDIKQFAKTRTGLLSSGEQTRVMLAKAMLNKPKLLLLDEPTASMDPSSARTVREKIRAFADSADGGVLWTSHNMYEVEATCDRVLFLSRGKILMDGNPTDLTRAHGAANLEELFIKVAREPLSIKEGL